jgi:CubicO group peptidase (beta-lactamase class C family)
VPRSKIRNIDLLRMSGGLRFLAEQDPDYSPDKGYADHFYIYTGAVDVFAYSIGRPLQFPPNTEGRCRNCDPLTIGYTWIVPSHDLVIVRMGHMRGQGPARRSTNAALQAVMEAVGGAQN